MSAVSELTLGYPDSIGSYIKIPKSREVTVTETENGVTKQVKKTIPTAQDTTLEARYSRKYIGWNSDDAAETDGLYNPVMPRHMIPGFYSDSDSTFSPA